jgi:hypothetical protein
MAALLPTLAKLLGILAVFVLVGLVLDRMFPAPPSLRRWMFVIGTIGVPVIVIAIAASGFTPPVVFVASFLGVFATTFGLPLIALRNKGRNDDPTARRRVSMDVALYLFSSVLWFAALYWIGSGPDIEGLHFEVAPVLAGAAQPVCITDPRFICNHLNFTEAFAFSAGNLLTLGAAGILPLDEFTRFLGLLQLIPVFLVAYTLARSR